MLVTRNTLMTHAPITFGAATNASALTTSYSGSFNADAGSDVFVAIVISASLTPSSVTYNGTAMKLVKSATSSLAYMHLYRLARAGTGTSVTVSISWNGSNRGIGVAMFSVNNVSSLGSATTAGAYSTAPSISSVQPYAVGILGSANGAVAFGMSSISGGTIVTNTSGTTNGHIAVIQSPTSATFSATWSGNNYWEAIGLPLNN